MQTERTRQQIALTIPAGALVEVFCLRGACYSGAWCGILHNEGRAFAVLEHESKEGLAREVLVNLDNVTAIVRVIGDRRPAT